jgi:hypothetical protein
MRILSLLFVVGMCATTALADGLSPMPLKKVLPRAEVVVLAEIVSNDVSIVERKPVKGRASVVYTCNIKLKVIEKVKASAPGALDLQFTFTVVKGVWLAWPGSGLEQQMKPTEKYVLLLTSQNDNFQLLRAEKASELNAIKKLLKNLKKDKKS